jgi:hypothetical protein
MNGFEQNPCEEIEAHVANALSNKSIVTASLSGASERHVVVDVEVEDVDVVVLVVGMVVLVVS